MASRSLVQVCFNKLLISGWTRERISDAGVCSKELVHISRLDLVKADAIILRNISNKQAEREREMSCRPRK